MKKLAVFIGGGLVASLLAAAGWLLVSSTEQSGQKALPPSGAILIDPSDSRLVNCSSVAADAKKFMSSAGIEKGSKLSLFKTGDADTAEEPVLIATFDVPFTRRVQEGRQKVETQIEETLGKMKEQCDQVKQSKRSPILLGIRRVVEHLRNLGCDGRNECFLSVQTDLQELSEQSVKTALSGKSKRKTTLVESLIDNKGITVYFCGAAEVVGKTNQPHDLQSIKLSEEVWRGVFTNSDKVVFRPHCEREE